MPRLRLRFLVCCLTLSLGAVLSSVAQEARQETQEESATRRNLSAIEAQLPLLEQEQKSMAARRADLEKSLTDEEKTEIEREITEKRARIREIRANIRSLASGVPEDSWAREPSAPRTLNEEFQDVLSPILEQLRSATSGPREISELREDITNWETRLTLAQRALERMTGYPPDEQLGPEMATQLEEVRKLWETRRTEAKGELEALQARLAERENDNEGFVESLSRGVSGFWRGKGLNLLLSILAFLGVFLIGRRLHALLRRHSPLHKRENVPVYARLLDLLAGLLIGLFATFASLLVLYFRGDWLLLSIATIVIAATVIASRNSILPYAEQIRTILNLGSVREGERIFIDGIPWKVETLGFYCGFRNPQLGDFVLRLPIREVIGLRSRPLQRKEPWFPCSEDDWVLLSDGVFGKILTLTPECVVLLQLGGSRRQYAIPDFLALAPENLSKGYRISTSFGIDYNHQAIATTEVPEILVRGIHRALVASVERENVKSVKVEFRSAGASSLDYAILADFSGEVARSRNILERVIQRTCVELCNEHGWGIPFTQITLHQATPPPSEA
ncbi:PAS domain-containing protein [Haloferula luteola]|uniref:PAS domain-containing protein n=1 Tax=Haloferula luteola TaxID=595692 RepID=A0A840V5C4_9BACT|nr:hypothetical protein [Haloferula luteola]MBB5349988.1 PAS domain-containing protein [Haloferula luteola]